MEQGLQLEGIITEASKSSGLIVHPQFYSYYHLRFSSAFPVLVSNDHLGVLKGRLIV